MYILKIIPIATHLPENYFSYFSKENISLGTLVEIKIKNRKIFGMIIDTTKAENEKINLKTENFALRKIERVIKKDFIKENLFLSIKTNAILLGTKESELLDGFIPSFVFDINTEDNTITPIADRAINNIETLDKIKTSTEKYLMSEFSERVKIYKDIIKKNRKENKSLVIYLPTINDIEILKNELEKDLGKEDEKNIIILHSGQNKKIEKVNLEKLKQESKSFLILSTPSLYPFLLKENINLSTVIIDKENSYNYFSHSAKKQIDTRVMIRNIAKDLNLDLVLAGEILSLNTFKKIKEELSQNEFYEHSLNGLVEKSYSQRKINQKIEVIDMTKEKEKILEKVNSKSDSRYSDVYFSIEIKEKLESFKKSGKGKIFLYTKRKGLHTETVCRDCNTILSCETCEKPLVLFKKNETREYFCASCKTKKEIRKEDELLCKNCGSWRMETLGIGAEGIEENLKEIGFKTFVLDSQNAKTKKQIRNIISSWQNERLSILIGTDLALSFFSKELKIDLAAIISIDTLFSIPEINIDEKIINLILEIKEKCEPKNLDEKILIQTRLPKSNIWEYVGENNYKKFLEDELENRRELSLPPYTNILKFRLDNKKLKYKNEIEVMIQKIWKEENLEPLDISWWKDGKSGDYIGMMIIKKEFWEIKSSNNKNQNAESISPTIFAKKITMLLGDFKLEVNPVNVYQ